MGEYPPTEDAPPPPPPSDDDGDSTTLEGEYLPGEEGCDKEDEERTPPVPLVAADAATAEDGAGEYATPDDP